MLTTKTWDFSFPREVRRRFPRHHHHPRLLEPRNGYSIDVTSREGFPRDRRPRPKTNPECSPDPDSCQCIVAFVNLNHMHKQSSINKMSQEELFIICSMTLPLIILSTFPSYIKQYLNICT